MRSTVAASRNSWMAQAVQNRLIALVLAMVVIVPLFASPADSHLAGIAALTFEAFAVLLMLALIWRAQWDFSRERVLTFLKTGANLPVLLFMGLALASCYMTSTNVMYSVQETVKLAAGVLLYFVVAYQFRQSKHLSMLVDTLLFLAVCVSFITMAQYTLSASAWTRGTALFGNQQPLGSLLMILLPIVAVIAISEKATKRQLVAQVATVMTMGALMLAHTRSAWIGAAAGLAVLAALALVSSAKAAKGSVKSANLSAQKHKFVLPLMLAIVTIGFFGLMTTQNGGIVERATSIPAASVDASFQQRQTQWWNGAVEMIKGNPFAGVGIGQFPIEQSKYTGEGITPAIGTISGSTPTGFVRGSLAEQAHNFYLQTGAELGLPGMLLVLAILGSFLYAGISRVGQMDQGIRRTLLMGSIASVVAFSIDALSSPSWQFGQVQMFFWLIMGAGVSCLRPRSVEVAEEKVVVVSRKLVRPIALVAASLFFSLVVLPTAALATHTPGHYNNDDDDDDDDDNNSDLLIFGGILLAAAFLFAGDRDDDDDNR